MQVRNIRHKGNIFSIFLLLLYAGVSLNGRAQTSCEDSLNFISEAYKDGQWSICKNAALNFIKTIQYQDENLFSSISPKGSNYSSYCKNNIPQVYNYLIKSYLRLYDLDSAKYYYFDALRKELKTDYDSTDYNILSSYGKLKKFSFSLYVGSVSTDLKDYKILNEFKLGSVYGFARNSYLELSYNKRMFNHRSATRQGIFGKTLKTNPQTFPNYNFSFSGNERTLDLALSNRFLLYRGKIDLNYLYFSTGAFVSYYLENYINGYEILVNNAMHTDTISSGIVSKRYRRIDSLNIHMDLERLYHDRFNYGMFISYGSNTRLPNRWELFAELRFTVGKNNSYSYPAFRSYKVGMDYFTIVVGITRGYNKIKMRRNVGE